MRLQEMPSNDFPRSTNPTPQVESPTSDSRTGRGLIIFLVLLTAALLLTPYVLVAAAAAAQPDMLRVLAEKPLIAAQLAGELVISLMICLLPFSRMVSRRPARGSTIGPEPHSSAGLADAQSPRQSAGQEH
jgi:hypothetical protein